MRLARIGPDAIFHRYLTPKWSFLPTSGAGASIDGGRFNRPGIEALYLSQGTSTALAEHRQDSSIAPPATLAAYRVTLMEVADLSRGYEPELWSAGWKDWDCPWRQLARVEGTTPRSWKLADELISTGRRGLLFPSTREPGGVNLVIFMANLTAADSVTVHDPDRRLPLDQSSWRP